MMQEDPQKIGEILVQLKVLKRQDVDRVLEALGRRDRRQKFGQTARDMGLLDEEHILAALAVQMDLLPGVHRLTLEEILKQLHSPEAIAPADPPAPPSKRGDADVAPLAAKKNEEGEQAAPPESPSAKTK